VALAINRAKFDEIRRANNIATEVDLAGIIGVDVSTLWRASNGSPVSGNFVAAVMRAFPHADVRTLFLVVEQ